MSSPTFTAHCINLSKIYNWSNYLYHIQPLITFHWLGRLLYVMFWGCWRGCRGVCFTLWLFRLTPWTVTQFWNKVQQNQHTIPPFPFAQISNITDVRVLSQKNPAIFNISRTGRVALMKLGSQSEEIFLSIREQSLSRAASQLLVGRCWRSLCLCDRRIHNDQASRCIKFCFKLGHSSMETIPMIKKVFGDDSMSEA
jgi:hypothetical protein